MQKAETLPSHRPELVAENKDVLSIEKIGKTIRNRQILHEVSFEVRRGQVVGLLGPNGAGKTTLFRILVGLMKPDWGAIKLAGHELSDLPMHIRARMGLGYLPQDPSIFRGLNVEDNIRVALETVEADAKTREKRLTLLLEEFTIVHLRRAPSVALSGGERRRVEIARALASYPSFILLDEPFAGIDPISMSGIRELVSHLKERGIGVLITDHNVREALELIDFGVILHDGNVLMTGTPDEILGDQDTRRLYLGSGFRL
ncbi:MAG: LPS export ABC transporter ATP-binding protein [Hyphomicrobiales bacterium]|nr:LPS export ABC transporter ATP-binding protein [Hyphomicrobiales bacterium]